MFMLETDLKMKWQKDHGDEEADRGATEVGLGHGHRGRHLQVLSGNDETSQKTFLCTQNLYEYLKSSLF
jgi:hypothetical protein